MKPSILNNLFSEELFRIVCWTLIHSLWQGLIAALLAACVIVTTRRTSALFRYNLLTGIFFLFASATAITFFYELNKIGLPGRSVHAFSIADPVEYTGTTAISPSVPENAGLYKWVDQAIGYLNQNAPVIVSLWFIVLLVKSVVLLSGLNYMRRIRYKKVYEPSHEWKARTRQLATALGIQKKIILLESGFVKVPMVVGILKAAIILPVGLLSNIPPDQAETILLHELAHIRRKDYLVNLLQNFVQMIFFFNPAVIWISSLMREEREACCDDVVMKNTLQKNSYIQALVSFQEYSLASATHGLALGGNNYHLLRRVKRLLTHENKKLNIMGKIFLFLGVIALMAFSFIPQKQPVKKNGTPAGLQGKLPDPPSKIASIAVPLKENSSRLVINKRRTADTVPEPKPQPVTKEEKKDAKSGKPGTKRIIYSGTNDPGSETHTYTATVQNSKSYTITKKNGQLVALSINGEKVPDEDLSKYEDLVEVIDLYADERRTEKRSRSENNMANRKTFSRGKMRKPAEPAIAYKEKPANPRKAAIAARKAEVNRYEKKLPERKEKLMREKKEYKPEIKARPQKYKMKPMPDQKPNPKRRKKAVKSNDNWEKAPAAASTEISEQAWQEINSEARIDIEINEKITTINEKKFISTFQRKHDMQKN